MREMERYAREMRRRRESSRPLGEPHGPRWLFREWGPTIAVLLCIAGILAMIVVLETR